MLIKVQITILLISMALAVSPPCHYSCLTCAAPLYSTCRLCPNNATLFILEDPSLLPQKYWTSIYPTGQCTSTFATGVNILGVIAVLIAVGGLIALRTKEILYIVITLQTFGLFSQVELGWSGPINYISIALSYLMPFNIMGSGYKSDDLVFTVSKNYRLKMFLVEVDLVKNLALIVPVTLVALILLIVCIIIMFRRNKRQRELNKRSLSPDDKGQEEGFDVLKQ